MKLDVFSKAMLVVIAALPGVLVLWPVVQPAPVHARAEPRGPERVLLRTGWRSRERLALYVVPMALDH